MSEAADRDILGRIFGRGGLPLVLQAEGAECGLACLAMVAGAFGHRVSLSELRRRFPISVNGVSLRALLQMSDALGMTGRPLRLELDEIHQLKAPAILHWDLNHYVVLVRTRGDRVWIHDPARGQRVLTLVEASKSFTGIAVEFTLTTAFEKKERSPSLTLRELFGRATGATAMIAQLIVLSLAVQIIALCSPILSQLVIDEAINRGDADLLSVIAVGMVILTAVSTAITLLQGFVGLYLGTQLSFQLQANFIKHLLRLPIWWFERRHVGDIVSRLSSIGPVQSAFTQIAPAILLNVMMFLVASVMMALYAPKLALLEVIALVLLFGVRLASFPYMRRKTDEGLHLDARVQSTLLETLRGARAIKISGRERERMALWQNEQAEATNNGVQMARFGLWGGAGVEVMNGAQKILVWFLGAKMVISGDLTLGMLIAFQAYSGQFANAAGQLANHYFSLRTLGLHLERLTDVAHAPPERGGDKAFEPELSFEGAVAVRDLSFRYAPHESAVLKACNFDIRPGEFACFVGPSGQGKSTLVKLLLGLNEPSEGEVLVDGQELVSFGLRNLRERSGVVMQDDTLFSGSIADNIAFFDPETSQEAIEEAARAARIHDDIVRLSMGYSTLIGDMGSSLSGGQRQRVLLARALYRKPKIIFLDEGTANLDAEREREIMTTLRELRITRIVVAHRQAAVAGADRVFLVDKGRIVEQDKTASLEAHVAAVVEAS